MRESIAPRTGLESSSNHELSSGISRIIQNVKRSLSDAAVFIVEPIAFEFRRMEEEAADCLNAVSASSLPQQKKRQLVSQIRRLVAWVGDEKNKHYHQFERSNPIIDIRHSFINQLEQIRGVASEAA